MNIGEFVSTDDKWEIYTNNKKIEFKNEYKLEKNEEIDFSI